MPKLQLSNVSVRQGTCAKPGCKRKPTYRHHRGSEHTFVRAFGTTRKAAHKTYKDFCERYHEFRDEDCVELCGDHHEEVHELYHYEANRFALLHRYFRPYEEWSWTEARALMDTLRKVCDEWIARVTPGSKHRRFTTFP